MQDTALQNIDFCDLKGKHERQQNTSHDPIRSIVSILTEKSHSKFPSQPLLGEGWFQLCLSCHEIG